MPANTTLKLMDLVNELKNKRTAILTSHQATEDILNNHHHAYRMIDFGRDSEMTEMLEWLNGIILKYDQTEMTIIYDLNGGTVKAEFESAYNAALAAAVTKARPMEEFKVPVINKDWFTHPDGKVAYGWHLSDDCLPASDGRGCYATQLNPKANVYTMPVTKPPLTSNNELKLYIWWGDPEIVPTPSV